MGVSVLGPLLVPSAPGALGPRDRVVLAALTVRAGAPVSSGALADALWNDSPPASWQKVVQGCVVRLRRLLGAAAISTEPGGYALVVPAEEIDARRFERLVGRAQELLSLGEPERACYCLGEALALWRGPALPELEGWDPGRIEAARLEDLRLDAEDAHLDAAMRTGRHRDVLAMARARVDEAPTRERRWALLALAQYRTGHQGDALRTLTDARAMLVRELGIDPSEELAELELAILQQDARLAAPTALGDASDACPWPGLVAFDVSDADVYFGREDDLSACMRRLREAGVLVVVGSSGSGKSSLVRAGVAAALQRDGRQVRIVTPVGPRPADVVSGTRDGEVLVVDQAEQGVRPGVADHERRRFLDTLVAHAGRGSVVVALRADRTGEVSSHEGFARLVERGLYLLGPMDDRSLRRAIEEPARQSALLLEPGLVDLVVRDVLDEPGGLPLMSHALRATWERREGRTLTVDAYRDSGGIRGAVSTTAEALYEEVSPDQQRRLRDLMLRLVAPSDAGEPFPARVPLAVVAAEPAYDHLVERLVGARLLTSTAGDVQFAHESLARAWPRLRTWLDEDRDGLRVLRHLTTTAAGWDAMGRPDSELYRGVRLAAAADWHGRVGSELTAVERAFLAASEARSLRVREEAERRAHREARTNRRLRILLSAAATLAVVALAASVLAARQADRADREATEAARQARAASARELAAASVANLDIDPERSVLLALSAIDATRVRDGVVMREAEEALHRAVRASRVVRTIPDSGSVAVTTDGSRVVIAPTDEADRHATVWDTNTGEALTRFEGPGVPWSDVAIDPTDQLVATSHADGTVRLWDLGTGELLRTISGIASNAPLAFVDGSRHLAVGTDGGVALWDVATGAGPVALDGPESPTVLTSNPEGSAFGAAVFDTTHIVHVASGRVVPLEGHLWPVTDISFSGDGTRVATTAHDGTARVWDAASGSLRRTFSSRTALISVAFSEDGTLVAAGGTDGTVRVWDTRTGEERARLAGHGTDVIELAFAMDARQVVTSGLDGTTRVWDITEAGAREWFTRASAELIYSGVSYSPDGSLLAAPAEPSGLHVWDAHTGAQVARLDIDGPKLTSVTFSPDGTMLASGSDVTLAVPVWDVASGAIRYTLEHDDFVRGVAFSPDGRLIATASFDGTSRLWAADTGEEVAVLDRGAGALVAVAFDATGGRVATAGDDGVVSVWEAASRQRIAVIDDHEAILNGVTFGPDDTLATAGLDGTARIFSLSTGRQLSTLRGHSGPVNQIAFSPDGRHAATTSDDLATRIWDRRTGQDVLTLTGHEQTVYGVAFSPDGRFLATGSADGTVAVHVLDVDELIELARTRVTRSLTLDECRQFLRLDRCPTG